MNLFATYICCWTVAFVVQETRIISTLVLQIFILVKLNIFLKLGNMLKERNVILSAQKNKCVRWKNLGNCLTSAMWSVFKGIHKGCYPFETLVGIRGPMTQFSWAEVPSKFPGRNASELFSLSSAQGFFSCGWFQYSLLFWEIALGRPFPSTISQLYF